MKFILTAVSDVKAEKEFLDVPRALYKNDPVWVSPLDMEVKDVFNPAKNELFKDGNAQRWILKDESGKFVGRIAAFYNKEKASHYEIPVGGAGFFECINDKTAAFMLFDAAQHWLSSKGMKAMDAPVNFGENDRFWGLLVEGFTHPSYGMNYNPPYYKAFFDEYGFQVYFEQVSRHMNLDKPMPERFMKIAKWVAAKPGITITHAQRDNLQKYTLDFMDIFNDAWRYHEHFKPMTEKNAKKLAKSLIPVLIDKYMIFAYVDNEPAGFLFGLPDLNQVFKANKGKMGLFNIIRFLWGKRNDYAWFRKKGILDRIRVLIIGVKPKFQKLGLESAMTMFSIEDAQKQGFRQVELSWVGDFNPMSRRLQDATGAEPEKCITHIGLLSIRITNGKDRKC